MPTLRLEGSGPEYQRIYRSLRRTILSGELTPGSRMPSTRGLASELGVSRNTVLLAFSQLLAEGYVEGKGGSGTYVASALPDAMLGIAAPVTRRPRPSPFPARRLSAFGRCITRNPPGPAPSTRWQGRGLRFDFRYGVPAVEEFPHELWRRLVTRRLRGESLRSLGYGAPEGYVPLREALAKYLKRARAIVCDPEQVIIVNGSHQALDLAARLLLDPGDRVVIEDPHSVGAREVFLSAGARLVLGAVDTEGLDVAALPPAAAGARLAYISPSHQFPTGAVMSLARRLALLAWAARAGAYVLEHDYDGEYRYEGRPIEAVQALDRAGRVIYVGTLSRVLFPALRLGYVVLPEPLVKPFKAAKFLTDRHTSTLQQEALADFIESGHFERYLRRSRLRYATRRRALLEALEKYFGDRVAIEGANAGTHVLVWLRDAAPSRLPALLERAARVGLGVYPATRYYLKPPRHAGFLLGYSSLTEDEIRAGIQRLATALG